MANTDKNRELLKDILLGRVSANEALVALQGPPREYHRLNKHELDCIKEFDKRYDAAHNFESFSCEELTLYILLHTKVKPDFPRRHLLDRKDLTTLDEHDAERAMHVVNSPWIKYFNLPEWLQE